MAVHVFIVSGVETECVVAAAAIGVNPTPRRRDLYDIPKLMTS